MKRHLINRFLFFLLGIILLYAPIALLTRLLVYLTGTPLISDVHRICLRMPIQWLAQPWMYGVMLEQPLFLIAILALPAVALVFGPLFCGWMCPPGMFTEFLSRLAPDRVKINLAGRVDPAPIRYGVLAGMMIAPFLGGNACCAFCNFFHMQNIVSAAFGNFQGISHWASFLIVTFVLWFVVLGLFTRGGRGWCNFLCPAGALMGLTHALGSRFRFGKAVRIDEDACDDCGECVVECPAWAISQKSETNINLHVCNACMDCIHVCPVDAVKYKRPGIIKGGAD